MKKICILILFLLGFSVSSKAQIHLGFGAPGVQHADTVEYGHSYQLHTNTNLDNMEYGVL